MIKFLRELPRTKAMSSYCDFARFYDELTENVEYEKRCKYIKSFLDKYNITGKIVSQCFSRFGYPKSTRKFNLLQIRPIHAVLHFFNIARNTLKQGFLGI